MKTLPDIIAAMKESDDCACGSWVEALEAFVRENPQIKFRPKQDVWMLSQGKPRAERIGTITWSECGIRYCLQSGLICTGDELYATEEAAREIVEKERGEEA